MEEKAYRFEEDSIQWIDGKSRIVPRNHPTRGPRLLEPSHIDYPESDGEPLADNSEHQRWITKITFGLELIFFNEEQVFIATNLLWYPLKNKPGVRRAPDSMVVIGRPKRAHIKVPSYRQWEEEEITPQAVFEVRSPSDTTSIMKDKFAFYDRFDVEEFYIIDPEKNKIEGWVRYRGRLEPIEDIYEWRSPRLGISFVMGEDGIGILDPNGDLFLEPIAAKTELDRQLEASQAAKEQERAAKEEALAQVGREQLAKKEALAQAEKEQAARIREQTAKEEALAQVGREQVAKEEALAQAEKEQAARIREQTAKEEALAQTKRDQIEKEHLMALLKKAGIDPTSR